MKDDDKVNDNDDLLKLAELEPHRPRDNPSTGSPVVLRASRVPSKFLPMPHLGQLQQHDPVITPSVSLQTKTEDDPQVTVEQPISESELKQSVPPGAHPDDPDPRCGFGLFSLPLEDPLTPACSAHDAANMLHHQGDNSMSRDEADTRLQNGLLLLAEHETGYRVLGSGFDKAYEILRAKILGKIGTFFNRWFW